MVRASTQLTVVGMCTTGQPITVAEAGMCEKTDPPGAAELSAMPI